MAEEKVLFECRDGVGRLTLNRPERRNAIDDAVMTALARRLDDIEGMGEAVRTVVLDAAGPIFSAGVDFNYISGLLGAGGVNLPAFEQNVALLQGTITRFANLPIPTVAVLRGACMGLGLELALAADIRVAGSGCRFALPESVLGLVADCGGTTRATRLAGRSWAKWILMLGNEFDAAQALSMGLAHQIADDASLQADGDAVAAALARRNPETLRQLKKLIGQSASLSDDEMLRGEIAAQRVVLARPDFGNYLMAGLAELSERRRKN